MSICDSLPQKISEYQPLSCYLPLALGLLYSESRPMTGAPLSELKTEANAYRARRLSSSDFGEGDVLAGKYRIEAVLGEGGMGIVLSATHIELGSRVAIKVLRPELAHTEDAVSRLLVEARSAASIRSEHVARVLDVGRLESGSYWSIWKVAICSRSWRSPGAWRVKLRSTSCSKLARPCRRRTARASCIAI
jgi:hypothetical protein